MQSSRASPAMLSCQAPAKGNRNRSILGIMQSEGPGYRPFASTRQLRGDPAIARPLHHLDAFLSGLSPSASTLRGGL